MEGFSFKKIIKGMLFSLAVSVVMMLVLAVFVYFMNIPDRTVSMLVFALSAIAVFLGALILARNISSRGLANGLIMAILYFAVLVGVSVIINGSVSFGMQNVMRMVSVLAAGMLGGVMGINTKAEGR